MRLVRRLIAFGYILLVLATAAIPLLGGMRPYAPLSILPAPQPIVVTIAYGTEKKAWLEQAAAQFQTNGAQVNGAPVRIELRGLSSREVMQGFRDGTLQAEVWSPASDVWLTLLNEELKQSNKQGLIPASGADPPKLLALSPLVVVAWQDRVAVLSGSDQTIWQHLHSATVDPQGWGAKGHPEWGFVKWGHTDPTTSNSGLQTLLLLAYAFHSKSSGLSVADVESPQFAAWLSEIERSATVSDSSGNLINDMIAFGPSRFDAVTTYEHLALEQMRNAQSRGQKLVLMYPPANLWSNHPYAILDAPWVTQPKREAARLFRDFLLSREQQEQALRFGFRPVVQGVALVGPDSPLSQYASAGVKVDIPQLVELPPAPVINALLKTWSGVTNK